MCLSCVRDKISPGAKVLDYGSGSGILSVAACLFGAERVVFSCAQSFASHCVSIAMGQLIAPICVWMYALIFATLSNLL